MPWGERVFAGLIGAIGLLWIYLSAGLTYWEGFAPGSGFLPMWLGIVLAALVALLLAKEGLRIAAASPAPAPAPSVPGRHRRIAAIMLGLAVCAAALEFIGFVAAVGGYLLYLLAYVERRGAAQTALIAGGTTAILYLLFHTWLGVPLPAGPWGF
jgi:hypothetical protein